MKRTLIIAGAVILFCLSFTWHLRLIRAETERRLTLAQYSFATGCYGFASSICPFLEDQGSEYCYKIAQDNCEPASIKYREWLLNEANEQKLSQESKSSTGE